MSQADDEEASKVYNALGHPVRKKIVEILGQEQRLGFKNLKEELGVSVGTLYFHLESLEELITQNGDKKYLLTEKGKLALKLLGSMEEQLRVSGNILDKGKHSRIRSLSKDIVLGRRLFVGVMANPKRFIPEVLIILGLGAWFFVETRIEPIIMFYNNSPTWSSSWVIVVEFILGWCAIFVLCELLPYVFYRRVGGEAGLFVGVVFALAPLLIPLSVLQLNSLLDLDLRVNWLWINVILLAFQAWVLCLLSGAISLSKGLKIERAALISMIVMYLNIGLFAAFFLL